MREDAKTHSALSNSTSNDLACKSKEAGEKMQNERRHESKIDQERVA